jgi:MYXO-CTERM domain-containing protein
VKKYLIAAAAAACLIVAPAAPAFAHPAQQPAQHVAATQQQEPRPDNQDKDGDGKWGLLGLLGLAGLTGLFRRSEQRGDAGYRNKTAS